MRSNAEDLSPDGGVEPVSFDPATHGRAVASVGDLARPGQDRLLALGWEVDDLGADTGVYASRSFRSLQIAREAAERELPAGSTVNWSHRGHGQAGGFVVGEPAVGPGVGAAFPVLARSPVRDGEARLASAEALIEYLTGQVDELETAARGAGYSQNEVQRGRVRMVRALAQARRDGLLRPDANGPIGDVRCAARWIPVTALRWRGFRDGWTEPDENYDGLLDDGPLARAIYTQAAHEGAHELRARTGGSP